MMTSNCSTRNSDSKSLQWNTCLCLYILVRISYSTPPLYNWQYYINKRLENTEGAIQKRTIQRKWQNRVHKTKINKNTTQYVLDTTINNERKMMQRFHSLKGPHDITKTDDNINMNSTITMSANARS